MFYHRKESSCPNQIKMLCDGAGKYYELYNGIQHQLLKNKNDSAMGASLLLKDSLTLTERSKFVGGLDITHIDLEKI